MWAAILMVAEICKKRSIRAEKFNQMTESVQKTRSLRKKIGVNENRETKLALDLAIAMTQDTFMIMQACNSKSAATLPQRRQKCARV